MVHVERLRAALEYIVAHPKEWEQSSWITRTDCGTAGCLAGVTAVKIMGATPKYGVYSDITSTLDRDSIAHLDFVNEPSVFSLGYVSEFAQRALELTRSQADELFATDNTLHDLFWYASEYTGGEIEIPEDVAALPRHDDNYDDWGY